MWISWLYKTYICSSTLFNEITITNYINNRQLKPSNRISIEKLTVPWLVKQIRALHGNRSFNTIFTTVCHMSLWQDRWIQSMSSNPIFKTPYNIILLSMPRSPTWSLSFTFPHQCIYFSHRARPSEHPKNIWWGLQIMKLCIMYFSPVTCYFLPVISQ